MNSIKLTGLFILLQAMIATTVMACPFEGFLALEKRGPVNPRSSLSIGEQSIALIRAFETDSRDFFHRYVRGELSASQLESCDQESADFHQRLKYDFPQLFLEEAALFAKQSPFAPAQRFADAIIRHLQSGKLFPLWLTLTHRPERDRVAGYDRETQGLFFVISEIEPKDWELYFFHEFAHALDSRLQGAIQEFAQPGLRSAAIAVIQRHSETPSAEDLQVLERFLRAGADRGIFAEFRAWVISDYLHQRGLSSAADLKEQWWKRAKTGFRLPMEGIFLQPLVQQAYQSLINRVNPQAEDFGDLAEFLK